MNTYEGMTQVTIVARHVQHLLGSHRCIVLPVAVQRVESA